MPYTPITFENVEVLRDTGFGRQYRIAGKSVFVGSLVSLRGTTAYRVGEVGRLVLPRWFVEQEGIEGGAGEPGQPRDGLSKPRSDRRDDGV